MDLQQQQTSFNEQIGLDEELHKLKKQLVIKENEWKKDKAVLEQKNELQQLQIEDYKKREENMKKMNETIMNTLNDLSSSNKPNNSIFKEIQHTIEQHTQDLLDQRNRNLEVIKQQEIEIRSLKDQINELKLQIKENNLSYEKGLINKDQQTQNLMQQNQKLEEKVKVLQDQKDQSVKQAEINQQSNYSNMESIIKEMKQDHINELNSVKKEMQKQIDDQKLTYEKEKFSLEQRLTKNQSIIKKYQMHMETNQSFQNISLTEINGKEATLKKEIEEILKKEIEEIKQLHQEEKNKLMNQKDQQDDKIKRLEEQLKQYAEKKTTGQTYNEHQYQLKSQQDILEFQQQEQVYVQPLSQQQDQQQMQYQGQQSQNYQLYMSQQGQSVLEVKNKIKLLEQQKQALKENCYQLNDKELTMQNNMDQQKKENDKLVRQSFNNRKSIEVNKNIQQPSLNQAQHQTALSQQINYLNKQQESLSNNNNTEMQQFEENNQLEKENLNKQEKVKRSKKPDIDTYPLAYSEFIDKNKKNQQMSIQQQPPALTINLQQEPSYQTGQHQQLINQDNIATQRDPNSIQLQQQFNQQEKIQENILSKNCPLNNQFDNQLNIQQPLQPIYQTIKQIETHNQKQILNNRVVLCDICRECLPVNEFVAHQKFCGRLNQQSSSEKKTNNNCLSKNNANISINNNNNSNISQISSIQPSVSLNKNNTSSSPISVASLNNNQDNNFYKLISELNNEKQIIEERLHQVEYSLLNSENCNEMLNNERDTLRNELNQVMSELAKIKMNTTVQNEEQEACTNALKNEIKFLINKLLKAKGKLAENGSNQQQQSSKTLISEADLDNTLSRNQRVHSNQRKDYSSFSIKNSLQMRNQNTIQNSYQNQQIQDMYASRKNNQSMTNLNQQRLNTSLQQQQQIQLQQQQIQQYLQNQHHSHQISNYSNCDSNNYSSIPSQTSKQFTDEYEDY